MAALLGKSASANEPVMPYQSPNLRKSNLTDLLIKKNMFVLDQQNQTVHIDEQKLIKTIKEELAAKTVDGDDSQIYVDLFNSLQPGSFGWNPDAKNLQIMSFDRPTQ
jgi:hypothetical protein